MPNELQPKQPSALSIAPDTPVQMVQQTGEKSIFANRIDNLNVTVQTLNTTPKLVTQAPKPTAIPLNNEYYNLFVRGDIDLQNIQPFTMEIDRALTEYIDDNIKMEFSTLSADAQKQIKTFPSIFAKENTDYGHTDEEQLLGIGYVRQIKVRREAVKIYPQIIYLLPQQRLNEALFELDIQGSSSFNEFNRTHWSIKKVDLMEELRELGFPL